MKMNLLKNGIGLIGLIGLVGLLLLNSCGGGSTETDKDAPPPKSMIEEEADPMENKGIGPITSVSLNEEIDSELAAEGQSIYKQMCSLCHLPDQKLIGPAPKGIMERRSPEWIMNMMLNPEEMIAEDPIAKALLIEFFGAPMTNQGLTEDQARAILEYFRTL